MFLAFEGFLVRKKHSQIVKEPAQVANLSKIVPMECKFEIARQSRMSTSKLHDIC